MTEPCYFCQSPSCGGICVDMANPNEFVNHGKMIFQALQRAAANGVKKEANGVKKERIKFNEEFKKHFEEAKKLIANNDVDGLTQLLLGISKPKSNIPRSRHCGQHENCYFCAEFINENLQRRVRKAESEVAHLKESQRKRDSQVVYAVEQLEHVLSFSNEHEWERAARKLIEAVRGSNPSD